MNLIVAVSKNWAIGKGNKLLFSIPEDMQFFKKMTLGKVVLMGYNTFLSLPKQQPLKDRVNIVLAPSGVAFDGVTVVNTLEELFSEVKKYNEDDLFVIGGGMFYHTMLPYCKVCYVTEIDLVVDADVYFDDLSSKKNWQREAISSVCEHNGLKYVFTKYTNTTPMTY